MSMDVPSIEREELSNILCDTTHIMFEECVVHVADECIIPIVKINVNPLQDLISIKARVVCKSDVRFWENGRSKGKYFTLELEDGSSRIKAIAFNNCVDIFFDVLKLNNVYHISNFRVKEANKNYSSLPHEYEILLKNYTLVRQANNNNDPTIPPIRYDNFTSFSELKSLPPNSIVDVIGVCKGAGNIVNLTARATKRPLKKRDVELVDKSNTHVTLTLWNGEAEKFDDSTSPVIAVKKARLGEFNGQKTLNLSMGSSMELNPIIPKSIELRRWFNQLEKDHSFEDIGVANSCLLEEIRDASIQDVEATIIHIAGRNVTYRACPNTSCRRKIIDQSVEGKPKYRCENCNESFDHFRNIMRLSILVSDWTGSQWVSMFDDHAEKLIGVNAEKILECDYEGKECIFRRVLLKKLNFRIRAKRNLYNNENYLNLCAAETKPVDFKKATKRLLDEIKVNSLRPKSTTE